MKQYETKSDKNVSNWETRRKKSYCKYMLTPIGVVAPCGCMHHMIIHESKIAFCTSPHNLLHKSLPSNRKKLFRFRSICLTRTCAWGLHAHVYSIQIRCQEAEASIWFLCGSCRLWQGREELWQDLVWYFFCVWLWISTTPLIKRGKNSFLLRMIVTQRSGIVIQPIAQHFSLSLTQLNDFGV